MLYPEEFIDFYELLSIQPIATSQEIKVARRNMLKIYHPDVHQDKEEAHSITQLINLAYETLMDETRRRQYDEQYKATIKTPRTSRNPKEGEAEVRDHWRTVEVTLKDLYYGADFRVELRGNPLNIHVPAGIHHRTTLEYKQENNSKLYVDVVVIEEAGMRYVNKNFYIDYPIDLFTAMFGGQITLRFFDEAFSVEVEESVSSEQYYKYRKKGVKFETDEAERGDLYVRFLIRLPKLTSHEQRDALEKFASAVRRTN